MCNIFAIANGNIGMPMCKSVKCIRIMIKSYLLFKQRIPYFYVHQFLCISSFCVIYIARVPNWNDEHYKIRIYGPFLSMFVNKNQFYMSKGMLKRNSLGRKTGQNEICI